MVQNDEKFQDLLNYFRSYRKTVRIIKHIQDKMENALKKTDSPLIDLPLSRGEFISHLPKAQFYDTIKLMLNTGIIVRDGKESYSTTPLLITFLENNKKEINKIFNEIDMIQKSKWGNYGKN